MKTQNSYLLSIYTRSPLHVGSGTSVDIVDLPVMRERITNYPLIPSTSLKGVLRQEARDIRDIKKISDDQVNLLFGEEDNKKEAFAGAMFIGEAKLLAFPARSLKGCFAWITCPLALKRFNRDTDNDFEIPVLADDACFAPDFISTENTVVLEEYPLSRASKEIWEKEKDKIDKILEILSKICDDPVWQTELRNRLVIVSDEIFQHFVTSTTEIVARIKMDPKKRTNDNLFNQENVPNETLFYSVCRYLGERKENAEKTDEVFKLIFPENRTQLQIGGSETAGLGLCEVKITEITEDGGQK